MSIAQYALIAYFILNIIVTVYIVGKPRETVTSGVAAGAVSINLFLLWLAVIA